jgi:flavin-binding protein dodecin
MCSRCGTVAPAYARRKPVSSSVYSVVELIGSSTESWEKAAANAVEEAARTIGSDLRVAEVVEQDVLIEAGKIVAYRSKVRLSYKSAGDGL